ncbi:MAG: FmdE family protein [Dehalococcoidia bacterium]
MTGIGVATSALHEALARSAERHGRLCPRQVLGVRIGLAALRAFEVDRGVRHLLAIVETDGCFVDGVEAATGCALGRRTLRLVDHGKVAATFVDLRDGRALRIVPRPDVREQARAFAPEEPRRYYAQLAAYQRMPDALLLDAREVTLKASLEELRGCAGVRVSCVRCGEEVIDGREVPCAEGLCCRGCAGQIYYQLR